MKKLVSISAILITACSQDMVTPNNAPSEMPKENIIGKWADLRSTYIETSYTGSIPGVPDTTTSMGTGGYIEFNADSSYYLAAPNNSNTAIARDTGIFTLALPILKMTSNEPDPKPYIFTITKLSETEMSMNYIDTTIIPGGIFVTKGFLEYAKQ